MFYAAQQMRRHSLGSLGPLLLDGVLDFRQVRERLLGPVYAAPARKLFGGSGIYLHAGGGNLRLVPQDWR